MPNTKKISTIKIITGQTVYAIIRRETDGYRMDDADGTFAVNPTDPYLSLAEDSVIKGLYEASESRTAWNDGAYKAFIYKQAGGSPAPASDTLSDVMDITITSDVARVPSYDSSGHVNTRTKATDDIGLSATQKADVNTEVDNALNTAIPGAPTSDSINERLAAIDNKLPTNYFMGSSVAGNKDTMIDAIAGYIDTEITAIKAVTDKFSFSGAGPYDVKATLDGETVNLVADQSGATIGTVNALGTQAKADVNAEVDNALDTAIPGNPTAGSVNERVKAIDDKLPTGYIMGSAVVTSKDSAIDSIVTALTASTLTVVSDAGNGPSNFKTDLSSTVDDFYKGIWIKPVTGILVGAGPRRVSISNGTSKFITLTSAYSSTPAAGTVFEIITE